MTTNMTQTTLESFFDKAFSQDKSQEAETMAETAESSDSSQSDLEDDSDHAATDNSESPGEETSSSTSVCNCQCCIKPETPYHPSEVSNSKVAIAHQSKERKVGQMKTYSRRIQPSWYDKYPWISVCTLKYKIFCSTCCGAKQLGLLKFSKYLKSVFIEEGYGNWSKALQRFRNHEKSDMHREAMEKLAAKSSKTNVVAQLSAQHEADNFFHRKMLLKLLSCIRYLARQGLPLRGHHEDPESFEGNLYQLLLLQAQDHPQMKTWLHKKEYISPEIVNELITMVGQTVLRQVLVFSNC